MRRPLALAVLLALVVPLPSNAGSHAATVVAGGGNGTGAPATQVGLTESHAIATDPQGRLVIGESQIRRINVVEHDGTFRAWHTTNDHPERIHVEPDGDVLYAFYPVGFGVGSPGIFRIDASSGTITTIAGGLGTGDSGDGGLATDATLCRPTDMVAIPDGRILITDQCANRVRVVHTDGTIHAFAGTGTPGFSGDGGPAVNAELRQPSGLAWHDGSLYIADTANSRIRRVDASGTITTVAGGGPTLYTEDGRVLVHGDGLPATQAALNGPTDVEVDDDGTIFINDPADDRVRRVDGDTGRITTMGLNAGIQMGLAGDGAVYLIRVSTVGWWHSTVSRLNADGTSSRVAGNGTCCYNGNGGPGSGARLRGLGHIALDADGLPVFSEGGALSHWEVEQNHTVRRLDAAGMVRPVAGNGTWAGYGPYWYAQEGGPATGVSLSFPQDVAVGPDGSVYVAEPWSGRVHRILGGTITTYAGGLAPSPGWSFAPMTADPAGTARTMPLSQPVGLSITDDGALYISDLGLGDTIHPAVWRVDALGRTTRIAGGAPRCQPRAEGVPAAGASLCRPDAIAVAGDGTVYIGDPDEHRVLRIDPDTGLISTFVGDGTCARDGDGGPAAAARVCSPTGLAVGPDGDLSIADTTIRRVDAVTGIISTVPGISGFDVAVHTDGTIYTAWDHRIFRLPA